MAGNAAGEARRSACRANGRRGEYMRLVFILFPKDLGSDCAAPPRSTSSPLKQPELREVRWACRPRLRLHPSELPWTAQGTAWRVMHHKRLGGTCPGCCAAALWRPAAAHAAVSRRLLLPILEPLAPPRPSLPVCSASLGMMTASAVKTALRLVGLASLATCRPGELAGGGGGVGGARLPPLPTPRQSLHE